MMPSHWAMNDFFCCINRRYFRNQPMNPLSTWWWKTVFFHSLFLSEVFVFLLFFLCLYFSRSIWWSGLLCLLHLKTFLNWKSVFTAVAAATAAVFFLFSKCFICHVLTCRNAWIFHLIAISGNRLVNSNQLKCKINLNFYEWCIVLRKWLNTVWIKQKKKNSFFKSVASLF